MNMTLYTPLYCSRSDYWLTDQSQKISEKQTADPISIHPQTHKYIVVKESIRNQLQELAEAQGYRSINQLLEAQIWVNFGVNPTSINEETSLKSASFQKSNLKFWWTGGDLNPRPPECKSGVHSRLNYRPLMPIFAQAVFLNIYLFKQLYKFVYE